MEEKPSRSCPQCGTPRVGNFRWCRNCQFDFDAGRVSTAAPPAAPAPDPSATAEPNLVPAFTLPPVTAPGRESAATAPAATEPASEPAASTGSAPAAGGSPATAPARPRIPPRLGLPLAAAATVGLILVVALILIPPRSSSPGSVASASASAGASGVSTPAPTLVVAATPFAQIELSGSGSDDVGFSIPDGASGLATITNQGAGPFVVWSVAADGTHNDQLVNTIGTFAGTVLFDEDKHSTTFSVESDGAWSIELKPVPMARTWDQSERLVGDGPDVILVVPPTSADLTATARYDGTSNFGVAVYATSGKQKVLNVVGPFNGQVPLPAGTSVIEVEADGAWSIDPG